MTTTHTDHGQPTSAKRKALATIALLAAAGAGAVLYLAHRNSSDTTDHGGGWIGPVNGEAAVVYEFHDASVAPDHHRSYTLTVWEGSARLVVDSYGDPLHDVTKRIDETVWQHTLAKATEFGDAESVRNEGCSGGTAEELTVVDGDKTEVVHVFVDHCDASGGANIVEAVGEVLPLFDLDTLLATA